MVDYKSISQIRSEFLEFFQEKGHTIVPSASLIPAGDPSLLFINSGMAQFKDVFLGLERKDFVRAADTQKCLRVSGKHNDLEEVGHDTYHHTFFEMLGNWSFGDYFKEEAIDMTWELLVHRWKLPTDRLYATVHAGDKELKIPADEDAATLWKRYLPESQVLYGSTRDNFWMMGETGPCGPCSEIHIDLRPDELRHQIPGHECVNRDLPTVIELWNLVFIQYNAKSNRSLVPLADCHVDTGMGLERLAAVMQGKVSTYDTDAFTQLFEQVASLTPNEGIRGYELIDPQLDEDKIRIAMRVVVDHIRGIVVAISDGATPSNVGQGYVIRRILRRAVRYGYTTLGIQEPFLYRLVPTVVDALGDVFPELREKEKIVSENIRGEERSFLKTLGHGLELFERVCTYIDGLTSHDADEFAVQLSNDASALDLFRKAYPENSEPLKAFISVASLSQIPGEIAFLLHDTYGFPIDLTQLMAREHGREVDMPRFHDSMAKQKERGRSTKFIVTTGRPEGYIRKDKDNNVTRFVGHETTVVEHAKVVNYDSNTNAIILNISPFYGEKGGQVGDTGTLNFNGEIVQVTDTQIIDHQIVHFVDSLPDEKILKTVKATATVDALRRQRIAKHHTATHLLHASLREVLGSGVEQKGSLVAEDHLRFDFNHYERVSVDDLRRVQLRVNQQIQKNIKGEIQESVPFQEALSKGAMALFGEKYDDEVRVVTFDPKFSVELCGGTHVKETGEIGLLLIQSEGSIASGIRRIQAIAGIDAVNLVTDDLASLNAARQQFKGAKRPVQESIAELIDTNRSLQKQIDTLRRQQLSTQLDDFINNSIEVHDLHLVVGQIDDVNMDMLRSQGQELRRRLKPSSIGILGTCDPNGNKAYLVAVVSDDLLPLGVNAGNIAGHFARQIGGGGGGRPDLATAGGREPKMLSHVLMNAPEILQSVLPLSK
ncbi:MAG: alanine--tRNA ligase [Bacteroidetes bacterium]|nr:alanine--tRNA ligase [Bacteroidota bacterium]